MIRLLSVKQPETIIMQRIQKLRNWISLLPLELVQYILCLTDEFIKSSLSFRKLSRDCNLMQKNIIHFDIRPFQCYLTVNTILFKQSKYKLQLIMGHMVLNIFFHNSHVSHMILSENNTPYAHYIENINLLNDRITVYPSGCKLIKHVFGLHQNEIRGSVNNVFCR